MSDKKLCKSNKHRMFCGVCGGFADFFGIDPTIVRLIFIILACIKGIGIIAYIICVFVIPSNMTEIDVAEDADVSDASEAKEKKTKKTSKKSKTVPHTDEEFDSYFSNK